MSRPEQLESYIKFCQYRQESNNFQRINFKNTTDLNATTILPLYNFILDNPKIEYVLPSNKMFANCISEIFKKNVDDSYNKSAPHIISIPIDEKRSNDAFQNIFRLVQYGPTCGGEQSFKYVIGELLDNIYQHSSFKRASVMIETYSNKGYVELCILDNGITIPESFRKSDIIYYNQQHSMAIADAVNGLSSKAGSGRGYGLWSTIKLLSEGLDSQIFLISGLGAIFISRDRRIRYDLTDELRCYGTLISVRIPYPSPIIDIYNYID